VPQPFLGKKELGKKFFDSHLSGGTQGKYSERHGQVLKNGSTVKMKAAGSTQKHLKTCFFIFAYTRLWL
jgi:hypothetical protein